MTSQHPGLDLHAMLEDALPAWRTLVGRDVQLAYEPAMIGGPVLADADALRAALETLVASARDASRPGDVVTIRTEHVEAAGAELGPVPPLIAGRYLRVAVQDTGRATRNVAYAPQEQPINITHPELSAVYAMAVAAGGALWHDTAPGVGTRAFIYLRMVAPSAVLAREAVLLVEDEGAVRTVVRRMLMAQGFVVREARDGDAALRLWHAERAHIRAVVTDVVMPVLGGRDLAREVRRLDPHLPILFISGFSGDEPDLLEGLEPPRRLVSKPFTGESLLAALRDVMGRATST